MSPPHHTSCALTSTSTPPYVPACSSRCARAMPSFDTSTHGATAQSASRARSKVALGSPAAAHTAIGAAAAAGATEKAAIASKNNAAAAIVLWWGRGNALPICYIFATNSKKQLLTESRGLNRTRSRSR